jgi:hypothetical protein
MSNRIRVRLGTVLACALCVLVACQVTVNPNDDGSVDGTVSIAGLKFAFSLGASGEFSLGAGSAPEQKAAAVPLLNAEPRETVQAAELVLEPAAVQAQPLGVLRPKQSGVTGTAQVDVRIGADGADPCAAGIYLGSFQLSFDDGAVTIADSSLSLPSEALEYVLSGTFTICLEVTATVDVRLTIGEMGVQFGPAVDGSGDNTNDNQPVDNGNDNEPVDNGNDNEPIDNQNDNEPVDNGNDNEPADNQNDNEPADNENDNEPEPGVVLQPAVINYEEALTVLVDNDDIDYWLQDNDRSIVSVVSSADGSWIAFTVSACGGDPSCVHTYIASPGGDFSDITTKLPQDIRNMLDQIKLNGDGSRLIVLTTTNQLYYCDLPDGSCTLAAEELYQAGGTHAIAVNDAGTRVWFKHSAGYDEQAAKTQAGIYYSDLSGEPAQLMHWDELPPPTATAMNMLDLLGVSGDGSRVLISWNEDFYAGNSVGVWTISGSGGGPSQVLSSSYYAVMAVQDAPYRFLDTEGEYALISVTVDGENSMDLIDLDTGSVTTVATSDGLDNFAYLSLAGDGQYVRYAANGRRVARLDLDTGNERDTLSYYTEPINQLWPTRMTDISRDGRHYYTAMIDPNRIYHIDMAPTAASFDQAPSVTRIELSEESLLRDGSNQITVAVTVTDSQGLGNIDWVKIIPHIDGVENPDWLAYDPWIVDRSSLSDDGETGGDMAAGDGVHTENTLRLNTGSNFLETIPEATYIGLRVIVKDKDENYSIADTTIDIAAP